MRDLDGDDLTVRLEVELGTITLASVPAGLIADGANGSSALTLFGSIDDINAALASVTYKNTSPSYYEGDALRISTSDGTRTDGDQVYFTVTGGQGNPKAAPVTTLTSETITLAAGTSYWFNGTLQVRDEDSGQLTVSLSVGSGALLVDAGWTGLIVSGAGGSQAITLQGSKADLNEALKGLAYRPPDELPAGARTETIVVSTSDGVFIDRDQIAFNLVEPSDDALVITSPAQGAGCVEIQDGGIGENATTHTAAGTITFASGSTDVVYAASFAAQGSGYLGTLVLGEVDQSARSLAWSFAIDDAVLDHLSAGEILIQDYLVTIADGHGNPGTQLVTVTLAGTNDVPSITGDATGTVAEDGTQTASGTLTAADGDGGESALQAQTDTPGDYGLFSITAGGAWTYALDNEHAAVQALAAGKTLTETFTVLSQDGTVPHDVVVTVTGSNDHPTLSATLPWPSWTDTEADDLFAPLSGTLSVADPDTGDTRLYGIEGGAASTALSGYDAAKIGAYGTLYLNSLTGAYAFEPGDAAIEGLKEDAGESFHLTVTDAGGATEAARLTVAFSGADDLPAAAGDSYAMEQGGGLTVAAAAGVLANDFDRDDAVLTARLLAGPAHGTLELGADGAFTYVPEPGFVGTDSYTYQARTGATLSSPTTVTIQVARNSDQETPPLARNDALVVAEDPGSLLEQVVTGNVLTNDGDPDAGAALRIVALSGEPLEAQATIQGRYGTLTLFADGRFAYGFVNTDALIAGETGDDRFVYTVVNAAGRTASAELTVTLAGADLKLTSSGSLSAHRGNDEITGGTDGDRMAGRAGNDRLLGEDGDDVLWGEAGDDALFGGRGDDKIAGGDGNDGLWLADGNDWAWGESGDDTIQGEGGDDTADGGDGDDTLVLGSGDDRGWGGLGDDRLAGGEGRDQLAGGAGADRLAGEAGNDKLWGENGNDVLDGGGGANRLSGGAGSDQLIFSGGDDTTWGGGGDDTFAIRSRSGEMLIKDFQTGDVIDLQGIVRSFSQLKSRMDDVGSGVVIDLGSGSGTITIERATTLSRHDFIF